MKSGKGLVRTRRPFPGECAHNQHTPTSVAPSGPGRPLRDITSCLCSASTVAPGALGPLAVIDETEHQSQVIVGSSSPVEVATVAAALSAALVWADFSLSNALILTSAFERR